MVKSSLTGKKGHKVIMTGYASNKLSNIYQVYNPKTWKVMEQRDFKWLDWKRQATNEGMDVFSKNDQQLEEVLVMLREMANGFLTMKMRKTGPSSEEGGSQLLNHPHPSHYQHQLFLLPWPPTPLISPCQV